MQNSTSLSVLSSMHLEFDGIYAITEIVKSYMKLKLES